MNITERQLTLDVQADPRVIPDGLMIGSLRVTGEFGLDRDLNRGDTLTVQVASADGVILATGVAEVTGVGFVNVTDKEAVLGTEATAQGEAPVSRSAAARRRRATRRVQPGDRLDEMIAAAAGGDIEHPRGLKAAIMVAERLPREEDGTATIFEVAQRRDVLLGYLREADGDYRGAVEALEEAIAAMIGPVRHAPSPTYTPQIGVAQVERWKAALNAAGGR